MKKLSLFIIRCKDAIQAGKLEDIDVSVDQGKWHNIKEEKIKKERSSQSSWSSVHVPLVLIIKP